MRDLQRVIIAEMGVLPEIDPGQEIERRVQFLADYLATTGARGLVLGISGGLDSTLAGKLAQMAVERRRDTGADAEFVAVRLPYRQQHDEEDARAALEFINADRTITLDVAPSVDGLVEAWTQTDSPPLSDFSKGNVKARVRMIAQYAVAGERGLLVIGTDHGAESVTGFFTKFGDGAADVLPLWTLNKRQNRLLLRHLGGAERLWSKPPTADLLDERPGQTDEAELGISYDHIDAYLEGREVPEHAAERIEAAWRRTRHKRTGPVTPVDTWWQS